MLQSISEQVAHPNDNISIKFETQWNFLVLLLIIYLTGHNAILHTPWQLYCRYMCKIMMWSVEHILNETPEFFVKFRIWSQ